MAGDADPKNSMVYLWDPKKPEATFFNISTLFKYPIIELGGLEVALVEFLGDEVKLDDEKNLTRTKREPKRGSGGGGRGSSGARASSAGRSSGARSSSSSSRGYSSSPSRSRTGSGGVYTSFSSSSNAGGIFSSSSSTDYTGSGYTRPHIWVFVHGHHHHGHTGSTGSYSRGYKYSDDSEFKIENDKDVNDVRVELSICFGKHKSRESCAAKVDAMVDKFSYEV